MPRKPRTPSLERAKTDDSLRTERKKTDAHIKTSRASAERTADGVVDHARAVADAVVSAARSKADHLPRRGKAAAPVSGERAEADRTVRGERAVADGVLRTDRQDQADALASLLVHERAATDAYLLTERARSDDAVANRDDFLGMVAHDVRNLLNGVVLNLELLQPVGAEPERRVSTGLDRIRRYVARMNRLIGDLVDVTSIDAGRLAMDRKEGDAALLAAEATDAFQPAAAEKGVTLVSEIAAQPVLATFDRDRMLQVFANLLANAIKFTPAGGVITLAMEEGRGVLRFSVRDTGVGIAPSMLQAIFERFWQVDSGDRRGQGLGLYISKCIVEAHGGRIWAESTVGKGTELWFTLPRGRSLRRGSPHAAAPRRADRPARRRRQAKDRRRG